MATAYKIHVSTRDAGIFNAGVTEEAALKINEVLQDNLEKHHIVYNMMGFHNHTAHHILTLFALGASGDQIEETYSRDRSYQKRARQADEEIVEEFQKGIADVLNDYLFVEDECEEMPLRVFTGGQLIPLGPSRTELTDYIAYGTGLLHPIIHLGFGIEFNQPALVAEGLAQACLHADWLGLRSLLQQAEHAADGIGQSGGK
ncbi:hypothetical protein N7504_009459 [Penicillium tannophilum]|nr:hypothetical protein N7504_009459 [Penicillium tannophilum]